MENSKTHDADSPTRLIAKVLRDVLAAESFDTYADLIDVLKTRLARLRIRWAADDITAAIALVESNRPVLVAPPRPTRAAGPQIDQPAPLAFGQLHPDVARLVAAGLRPWPGPPRTDAEHAAAIDAQRKAEQQAAYRAERRRRPLIDRLADIFGGRE